MGPPACLSWLLAKDNYLTNSNHTVLAMSSSSPSLDGNSPDSPLDLCVRSDDPSSPMPPLAPPPSSLYPSSPNESSLRSAASATPFTSLMNSLVAVAASASVSSNKFKSKIWSPAASCESERENEGRGGEERNDNRVTVKEQDAGKRVRKSNGSREERTFKVRTPCDTDMRSAKFSCKLRKWLEVATAGAPARPRSHRRKENSPNGARGSSLDA